MDILAMVAAPTAIASSLLLLSFSVSLAADRTARLMQIQVCTREALTGVAGQSENLENDIPTPREYIFADSIWFLATCGVALLLGWRVNVNEFSLQAFYKNGPSRCYRGQQCPGCGSLIRLRDLTIAAS
jgi:hypothetical protein